MAHCHASQISIKRRALVSAKALVWVVLGSLIRPTDLIPYAIMVAAAPWLRQSFTFA